MRKLIITVIILGLLGGGYYYARKHAGITISIFEGKVTKSRRGDLIVPITASGKIEPASIIEIKSKASGEVTLTPFIDGAMVKADDLIIQLDPKDEQLSVDRAEADAERARIAVSRAELTLKQQREVGIPSAEAKLKQAQARRTFAELDFKHQERLKTLKQADGSFDPSSDREWADAKARLDEAEAGIAAAEADLRQSHLAVQLAELEVKSAKETLTTVGKTLEEARERLSETKVLSPINGMVLARHVQRGAVIQGGKTSLTGGTVLMEIADVSSVYAVVNVDEADIGQVRDLAPPSAVPGSLATQPATLPADMIDQDQPVEVTVESFRDEKFEGIIERIAPQSQLIQAIATFKVWIRITSDNRDKLVGLLNTQAEARFTVNSVKNAVLVNYDAIMPDPNKTGSYGVYIQVTDPVTHKSEPDFKKCRFGLDNGIDVEVLEGLNEGVTVYTELPQKTRKEQEAEESKANEN